MNNKNNLEMATDRKCLIKENRTINVQNPGTGLFAFGLEYIPSLYVAFLRQNTRSTRMESVWA